MFKSVHPHCELCERPSCALTPVELLCVNNMFARLDTDNSGFLDASELFEFVRASVDSREVEDAVSACHPPNEATALRMSL